MILSGTPPFRGRRDAEVLAAVKRGKYSLSGPRWEGVSEEAKSFIRHLLIYNPAKRWSAEQALQHPWLAGVKHALEDMPLPSDVVPGLRRFARLQGWKRATLEAVAFSLPDEDKVVAQLRDAFEKLDKNGSGLVPRADFVAALRDSGVSAEEAVSLYAAADTEHRAGGLAYTEWLAATLPKHLLVSPERLRQAYDALDVDGAGFLTRASFLRALGDDAASFESGEIDALADPAGRISFESFYAAFTRDGDFTSPALGAVKGPALPVLAELNGNGDVAPATAAAGVPLLAAPPSAPLHPAVMAGGRKGSLVSDSRALLGGASQ